jgi:hypothetical protein
VANELLPHETFVKGRRRFGNIAGATSTSLFTILLPRRNTATEAGLLNHQDLPSLAECP